LPRRPLPGRKNIVITDVEGEIIPDAVTAYSIGDALGKCKEEEDIFIIGGGSIYRQFMPLADRLYITHVRKSVPADTYFPEIDQDKWEIIEKADSGANKIDSVPYTYIIYVKKGSSD